MNTWRQRESSKNWIPKSGRHYQTNDALRSFKGNNDTLKILSPSPQPTRLPRIKHKAPKKVDIHSLNASTSDYRVALPEYNTIKESSIFDSTLSSINSSFQTSNFKDLKGKQSQQINSRFEQVSAEVSWEILSTSRTYLDEQFDVGQKVNITWDDPKYEQPDSDNDFIDYSIPQILTWDEWLDYFEKSKNMFSTKREFYWAMRELHFKQWYRLEQRQMIIDDKKEQQVREKAQRKVLKVKLEEYQSTKKKVEKVNKIIQDAYDIDIEESAKAIGYNWKEINGPGYSNALERSQCLNKMGDLRPLSPMLVPLPHTPHLYGFDSLMTPSKKRFIQSVGYQRLNCTQPIPNSLAALNIESFRDPNEIALGILCDILMGSTVFDATTMRDKQNDISQVTLNETMYHAIYNGWNKIDTLYARKMRQQRLKQKAIYALSNSKTSKRRRIRQSLIKYFHDEQKKRNSVNIKKNSEGGDMKSSKCKDTKQNLAEKTKVSSQRHRSIERTNSNQNEATTINSESDIEKTNSTKITAKLFLDKEMNLISWQKYATSLKHKIKLWIEEKRKIDVYFSSLKDVQLRKVRVYNRAIDYWLLYFKKENFLYWHTVHVGYHRGIQILERWDFYFAKIVLRAEKQSRFLRILAFTDEAKSKRVGELLRDEINENALVDHKCRKLNEAISRAKSMQKLRRAEIKQLRRDKKDLARRIEALKHVIWPGKQIEIFGAMPKLQQDPCFEYWDISENMLRELFISQNVSAAIVPLGRHAKKSDKRWKKFHRNCKRMLRSRARSLRNIFRYYSVQSSGGGETAQISINNSEFSSLMIDTNIVDGKYMKRGQVTLEYMKSIRHWSKIYGTSSDMMPESFVECLIRLAILKYKYLYPDDMCGNNIIERIKKVLDDDFTPKAFCFDLDRFRELIFSDPHIRNLITNEAISLFRIFIHYAHGGSTTNTKGNLKQTITLDEMMEMLTDCGLYSTQHSRNTVTNTVVLPLLQVSYIFNNVQSSKLGRKGRRKESPNDIEEDTLEIDFKEFVEVVMVLAFYIKPNPYEHRALKIKALIKRLKRSCTLASSKTVPRKQCRTIIKKSFSEAVACQVAKYNINEQLLRNALILNWWVWQKKWTKLFESIHAIKSTKNVAAAKKASKMFIKNSFVKKKLREVRLSAEGKIRNLRVMHRAALRIQCAYRGRVARKMLRMKRIRKKAAIGIQAVVRGRKGRLKVKQMKEQHCAACTIQNVARGKLSRNLVLSIRKNKSVTVIQVAERGRQSKARVTILKKQRNENLSATKIQNLQRTRVARRKTKRIRKEKKAAITIQTAQRGKISRKRI